MRALLLALTLLLASLGTAVANHPQQAGPHATSFDHRTGNEWWVEVLVAGAPSRVEAKDDGGAWTPLALKSWGAWAASFHIEPGHRVQFRASWSDGATVESCWFTHPAGVEQCGDAPPPPPPPPGAFTFTHGGGNEWWVEAKVSPQPAAVQSMDTGGAWVSLSFKSWGEWAASYHIEPGHDVKFRARLTNASAWEESCWFAHPGGALRSCGAAASNVTWPREGSYVRYYVEDEEHWPTGAQWDEYNRTLTYRNGAWQEEIEGWHYLDLYREGDGVDHADRYRYIRAADGPGFAQAPAYANETSYATKQNGASIQAPALAWWTESDPECPCGGWDTVVHNGTNLTLSVHRIGRMSYTYSDVKDTDAPIAPQDARRVAPPAPAWPREGSYAKYAVHEWNGPTGDPYDLYYNVSYRYTGGSWVERCSGTMYRHDTGSVEPFDTISEWSFGVPLGPTAISNGTTVQVGKATNCGTASWGPDVIAKSWVRVNTNRTGAPYAARAWYADESDAEQAQGIDYDFWWDPTSRLVLKWEDLPGGYDRRTMGNLTDTDAPLRSA